MVKDKAEEGRPIIKLASVPKIEFVTSGIDAVDELIGGYPRAKITEIYGNTGTGKSTMMYKCLAVISKTAKVLYIDVENALNPNRVIELGADASKVDYSRLYVLQEVAELVNKNIKNYDMIIIDSVAAMVPREEHQGETGEQFVGLKPRLMGQWMRKLEGPLGDTKCAVVFINQLRETMELYGNKRTTPGGRALPYAASLRLELSSHAADRIIKDKINTGHWVNVKVSKTKLGKPFLVTKFKLEY